MSKQLKKWNGRGQGSGEYKNGHAYVAARSVKRAAMLLSIAFNGNVSEWEIKKYFSNCWGNAMNNINPKSECVYATKTHNDKPIKLL